MRCGPFAVRLAGAAGPLWALADALLMVNLTPADISDSAGAQTVLDGIRKRWLWVKHLFADGAYDRLKLIDKAPVFFMVEVHPPIR